MLPLPARPSTELQCHLLRDAFPFAPCLLPRLSYPVRSGRTAPSGLSGRVPPVQKPSLRGQYAHHAWFLTARTRPVTAGPLTAHALRASRTCSQRPLPPPGPAGRETDPEGQLPGPLRAQMRAHGERRGRVGQTGAAPSAALAAQAFQPQQAANMSGP